ncbi:MULTISPECIES: TlpA disulfide reductase family protein [unclassified Aureispira]|uniref:TlpA family protein disulfide reductase n=1 Tax=unclassified Aureispira TaxID=2649989 RepID=UPI0006964A6B|nr:MULTISPECIES: TlpA disulfide reductase family protein [unclassified Aureispira]WMX12669.1 TlpA disulfide reductase family protein [Aureispira sp. CCB-E]
MIRLIMLTVALLSGVLTMAQDRLPDATLKTSTGQEVNAKTLSNDGKPFVVVIWATWDSPSKRLLNTIHEEYEDWVDGTGVKLIAVSIDDARNMARVKPYVVSKGWQYEYYLNPEKDFMTKMNANHPPHVAVFDGEGKLMWKQTGYEQGDEEKILEAIKKCIP